MSKGVRIVELDAVKADEREDLLQMAAGYWNEIMPHSDVIANTARREKYFAREFAGVNKQIFWGVSRGLRVGFVSYEVIEEKQFAQISNVYVSKDYRRKHYGASMIRLVFRRLDKLGIERIDLNVRRDNPSALAFWESQGFGVAGYRLRMYRDPENKTAYVGSLSSDFANDDVPGKKDY